MTNRAVISTPDAPEAIGPYSQAIKVGNTVWLSGQITGVVLGAIAGSIVAIAVLRWFKSKDSKVFAYYLMHDFAYSASERGAYPPALESRLIEFRRSIAPDEIYLRDVLCLKKLL